MMRQPITTIMQSGFLCNARIAQEMAVVCKQDNTREHYLSKTWIMTYDNCKLLKTRSDIKIAVMYLMAVGLKPWQPIWQSENDS